MEEVLPLLSPDELVRGSSYIRMSSYQRFVLARGNLRKILSLYLGKPPQDIVFEYTAKGKPFLSGKEVYFNVSHSHDLAVYAVSKHQVVGVDIEYIPSVRDVLGVAKRFFCPREYEWILGLPPASQQRAFLQLWTAKEAYLKATGEGIAGGLSQVEVCCDALGMSYVGMSGWILSPLVLGDYLGTICLWRGY